LFPTDGSDGADVALVHAIAQAKTHGATLHVLYVTNTTYLGGGAAEATNVDALRAIGEKTVEKTLERVSEQGIDAVGEQRDGDPYREILEYSDSEGIDLIVMGTHGRTGLDRYLLGSVTEKVVRTSDAPVLTVRLGETE
jgi:nucleotide-binding universal stress UspA family protein